MPSWFVSRSALPLPLPFIVFALKSSSRTALIMLLQDYPGLAQHARACNSRWRYPWERFDWHLFKLCRLRDGSWAKRLWPRKDLRKWAITYMTSALADLIILDSRLTLIPQIILHNSARSPKFSGTPYKSHLITQQLCDGGVKCGEAQLIMLLNLKSGVHIHIVFSTIPNIFFDPSFYVMDNSLQLLVSDSDLLI